MSDLPTSAPPGFNFATDGKGGLRLVETFAGGEPVMSFSSDDYLMELVDIAHDKGHEIAERLKAYELIGNYFVACLHWSKS